MNYSDLKRMVARSTLAVGKNPKKFGKLLPTNKIMYYINVNFKVGWQLVHEAGEKLSEVAEVVVWFSINLSLPHLPIAKEDYKSQLAIG